MVSADPGLNIVKITDFGIAKMAQEEIADAFKDQASTTGSQTVMGALPYMAPEMIMDQKTASLPADIWALGAILYQIITGELPYGKGLGAAPRIVSGGLPPQPALLSAKPQFSPLTKDLWNIVTLCLQKNAEKRPTADQLVELCAALCCSEAPRRVGVISTWKYNAWGFISTDDHNSFFHGDSFYGLGKVEEGQNVNFC